MVETVDLQRLLVSLEANIKKYERELQRATGVADRRSRQIENRFKRTNKAVSSSLAGIGSVLGRTFAAGATFEGVRRLVDASTRITNALNVAGLSGTELTSVYDRLFESAQRNAAPFETLAVLYSRVAIAQKELGINQEELLNFTDKVAVALRVSGKSAEESRGALIQLTQALGSGVVRAEEFNSILEGALPIAQAAAAGLEEAGGSVAKLRRLVIDGKVSSETFFRAFEAGAVTLEDRLGGATFTVAQGFTQLYNAAIDAGGRIDDATGFSDDLKDALTELADVIIIVADKVSDAKAEITAVSDAFNEATATVNRWGQALGRLTGLDNIGKALGLAGNPIFDDAFRRVEKVTGTFTPPSQKKPVRTVSINDAPVTNSSRSGADRLNQYEQEIAAIRERTAVLRAETALVGESALVQDRARVALDLETAARRAGIKVTDQHRETIAQLADSYAEAAESVRLAEDRFEAITSLQREFGSLAADSITGLIDGTKTLNDVLSDTLKRLAELLIQSALLGEGPLAALTGTARGGGVGGLIGALFGGFRASGGPVSPGKAYVVGERGPELFKPSVPGAIVPQATAGTATLEIVAPEGLDVRLSSQMEGIAVRVVHREAPPIVGQMVNERRRRSGL